MGRNTEVLHVPSLGISMDISVTVRVCMVKKGGRRNVDLNPPVDLGRLGQWWRTSVMAKFQWGAVRNLGTPYNRRGSDFEVLLTDQ